MKVVIIGTGPTAITVAKELRRLGYREKIVMLSKESFPPYSPPLMLDYLKSKGESKLVFWKGIKPFNSLDIDCLFNSPALLVDTKSQLVFTPNKELHYDYLVIATGAELWSPVRCDIKDKDLPYYDFKSLASVNNLIEHIKSGIKSAVIIGGGFIGLEVAISLNEMGINVLLVEKEPKLLSQMLSTVTSKSIEESLISQGVKLYLSSKAISIIKDGADYKLILEDGSSIKADVFIAATGISPNVSFLKDSNIKINSGILVDEFLKTNIPNIYAGGDVVETPDLISKKVYPHATFREAVKHGNIIASNILGHNLVNYGDVKINSLYHFGLPLVFGGVQINELEPDDEIVFSKDGIYKHILLKDKKVIRFEFWSDIKGCGLIANYMEQKRNFDNILYSRLR